MYKLGDKVLISGMPTNTDYFDDYHFGITEMMKLFQKEKVIGTITSIDIDNIVKGLRCYTVLFEYNDTSWRFSLTSDWMKKYDEREDSRMHITLGRERIECSVVEEICTSEGKYKRAEVVLDGVVTVVYTFSIRNITFNRTNVIFCEDCGKYFDVNLIMDDIQLCPECMEQKYFLCDKCQEWHKREEITEFDGLKYCQHCIENYTFVCHITGIRYGNEKRRTAKIRGEKVYIHYKEVNDKFYFCGNCTCYIPIEEGHFSYIDGKVCNTCKERDFIECLICKDIMRKIDADILTGGCHTCSPYLGKRMNYGFKPEPIFHGYDRNGLYFGFELEMQNERASSAGGFWIDRKDTDRIAIAKKYFKVDGKPLFYGKNDGSLDYGGFELVSHPMSYQFAMNFDFGTMFKEFIKDKWYSHNAKTNNCGLHIHMSRKGFLNKESLEKFTFIFEKFFDEIQFFSRRNKGYDGYCYKITRNNPDEETFDRLKSNVQQVIENQRHYDRHCQLNFHNTDTIEVRVFRGTLNAKTFKACIQFCKTVLNIANTMSFEDIDNLSFDDIISLAPKKAKEIREYWQLRKRKKPVDDMALV